MRNSFLKRFRKRIENGFGDKPVSGWSRLPVSVFQFPVRLAAFMCSPEQWSPRVFNVMSTASEGLRSSVVPQYWCRNMCWGTRFVCYRTWHRRDRRSNGHLGFIKYNPFGIDYRQPKFVIRNNYWSTVTVANLDLYIKDAKQFLNRFRNRVENRFGD